MACHKKINRWVLDNSKTLNLKVHKLSWPESFGLALHDFEVSFQLGGNTFIGRGQSHQLDLAFTKASVEACERALCSEYRINSTGVAGHSDLKDAKKLARNELLERDLFLCYFLTNTKFQKIRPRLNDKVNYEKISSELNKKGIRVDFYSLSGHKGLHTTFVSACLPNNGIIVGLSSEANQIKSEEKAFLETLINSVAYLDQTLHSKIELKNLDSLETFQSMHHQRFNLMDNSIKRLTPHLDKVDNKDFIPSTLLTASKEYELVSSNEILKKCPAKFSISHSDNVQKVFYGPTKQEHINFKRLSSFIGKGIEFVHLNNSIHPLG